MNEIDTFQHYQVLRREDGSLWELGRGAMGVTYKAFDINLRCMVALKVINSSYLDHPVARQRFIREARAAAQLRHRNIASVFHLGMDAQSFFYAMEFIDGETLDSLVRRNGPLPAGVALRIALQAARALNAAARRRLLHRDIKPMNLMIVDEDEEAEGEGHLVVKIIDFGLARSIVHNDVSTQLTVNGFVGTPQYASPEQLEEKELDARSDIYSLGGTLWFLLAGRPPFMGTLTSLISQHLTKEPPWHQLGNVPEPVRALLGRMLQKDPALRPQSPGELRREIEQCLKTITSGDDAEAVTAELDAEDLRLLDKVASNRSHHDSALGVGALVANRYQLTRLVGEGNAGRVFQAQDILSGNGRLMAVKVFNPELVITPRDHEMLVAEVARLRAAKHKNLLEVFSLERHADHACLVMEWGGETTLVDVLRKRGILTLAEALALLKQAAAAADHAQAHDLSRLELGVHQILINGTGAETNDADHDNATAANGELSGAVVKIDALGAARDSSDLATWAGGVTLVPQRTLNRDTLSSINGLVEGTYLHALAFLFYELANGAPPPAGYANADKPDGYLALPALGGEGNAVLKRALSVNPGFANNTEFFELLARTLGFDPLTLLARSAPRNVGRQAPSARLADAPPSASAKTAGSAGSEAPVSAGFNAGLGAPLAAASLSRLGAQNANVSDTKAQTVAPSCLEYPPRHVHRKNARDLDSELAHWLWKRLLTAALALAIMFGLGWMMWRHQPVSATHPPQIASAAPPAPLVPTSNLPLPAVASSSGAIESVKSDSASAEAKSEQNDAATLAPPSFLLDPNSADFAEANALQDDSDGEKADFGATDSVPDWRQPVGAAWFLEAGSQSKAATGPLSLLGNQEGLMADLKTDFSAANGEPKKPLPKRDAAKLRYRKPARRPEPPRNFWQKLFGVKPDSRRAK